MAFEFDGEKYKKASNHQKEWANRVMGEFSFKGNERILDLGCGDGRITEELAVMVPDGEVIGIDASKGMIETALQNRGRENVQFKLLDVNAIEYIEEFDLIFSNAALHWVLDHQKLLENIYRALKPNGMIRFNFGGKDNCTFFHQVIKEAMEHEAYAEFFRVFTWPWYMPSVEEYEVVAGKSAFEKAEIWGENADRYFENSEMMIRWIDQPSLVPFLPFLPEEKQKGFREFVIEKMIERTLQDDGSCFETFRRINIRARKLV